MKKLLLLTAILLIPAFALIARGAQEEDIAEVYVGQEAPELAAMVERGELPPLEERLPVEPMVVVVPEVGRYGGVLRSPSDGVNGHHDYSYLAQQTFFRVADDFETPAPNVARGWEWNDDFTVMTVFLREGMKWSDGHPYTADDILFWYEDILLNEELNPVVPAQLRAGGETIRVEKIDDYTVRFHQAVPYQALERYFAVQETGYGTPHTWPKHYLSQYHINHNPDAEAMAGEEGYDAWYSWFGAYAADYRGIQNPDRPEIQPWTLDRVTDAGNKHFLRNPYYWKVDQEGNQLPYIDEAITLNFSTEEVMEVMLMAGEFDFSGIWMDFASFPTYRTGEQRGNYVTILMSGMTRGQMGLTPNHWHPDPVLRELISDVRFRNALSYAIDREEMNEVIYTGLGTPWTLPLPADSNFITQEMLNWVERDLSYGPERAAELLDEIGLEWDSARRYRLRPDGRTLTLGFDLGHLGLAYTTRLELIQEYWEAIGIRTEFRTVEGSLYWELVNSQTADFAIWPNEWVEGEFQLNPSRPSPHGTFYTNPWWGWYQSGGATGEEPPADALRVYELAGSIRYMEFGSDEYIAAGQELVELHLQNRWMLLDIFDGPSPVVLNRDLVTPVEEGLPFVWPYQKFWHAYHGDTWYYR